MYYNSNALYDYIKQNNIGNFEFVSGNMWQLVYGDTHCNPILLVLVSAVKQQNLFSALSQQESNAFRRLQQIGQLRNIPVLFIRFAVDIDSIDSVVILESNNLKSVTMIELTSLFAQYGLPINEGRSIETTKYLNTKTSSAYHTWQRSTLGNGLKVSDIDLFRINPFDKSIITVYELKRSFIDLNDWQPYVVDYNNFKLLSNLFNPLGIDFKIVYNVRHKNPWRDDISNLKLFNVASQSHQLISFDKYQTLNEFITG